MAGRTITQRHRLFNLVQRVGPQRRGHAVRDFDHPDQQFEFTHGANAAIAVDPGDQFLGHFGIDIAARLDRMDDEAGQRLDEEIAPFRIRCIGDFIGDEQRFGLVRTHPPVSPAKPPKLGNFCRGNQPVTGDLRRQVAKFHGHCSQAPSWKQVLLVPG